ncbi:hydrogenase maturation protease [Streptomyces sp. NPDC059176]|uniref:hydrogenase maturation protease n=1 Tax=unclassified Streptomyces TaxID=2593676 RepID=UPI003699109A
MEPRTRIALIGLGNGFRRDDGVGRAVVDALCGRAVEQPLPPGVALGTCDDDAVRLVGLWHEADLAVVVDACHAHPGHPGRVTRLELDAERLVRPADRRVCGRVLHEAVELSRMLGRLPRRLVVYAVQGADASLGTGLSPAVAAMVEPIAASVEGEIDRHRAAALATSAARAPRVDGHRPDPVACSPLQQPPGGTRRRTA